jgi:hypothetical protein
MAEFFISISHVDRRHRDPKKIRTMPRRASRWHGFALVIFEQSLIVPHRVAGTWPTAR